jgi:uncharacterized membrane protein YfcA
VAWILPTIPVGVWIGRAIVGWINQRAFEWMILLALAGAGIYLLFGTPPS